MDYGAIILATIAGIVQLGTAYMVYLARQDAAGAKAQSIKNGKTIEIVHEATNSMKDELVKSTAKASYAEGKASNS